MYLFEVRHYVNSILVARGNPPLGYDVKDRKLVGNEEEEALVRRIFERFVTLGSATLLVQELNADGCRTKSWKTQTGRRRLGRSFDKGAVYKLLNNQVYIGRAVHKGTSYPGEHEAIIDQNLWDRVHAVLAEHGHKRGNRTRARTPAPLRGLLRCSACGCAMSPTHTRRRGRLYRYYVCLKGMKIGAESCPVRSIAAAEIEGVVLGQIRCLLQTPEVMARTIAACHELSDDTGDAAALEHDVIEALGQLDLVWEELFPAEQTRILRLLIERIDVAPDGIDLRLRTAGIHSLVGKLISEGTSQPATSAGAVTEEVAA